MTIHPTSELTRLWCGVYAVCFLARGLKRESRLQNKSVTYVKGALAIESFCCALLSILIRSTYVKTTR